MATTVIGFCEIDLYLPGVASLKEKRSILKSMLAKMRNQFNIANAEVGHHDVWQSSTIAITTVSNSNKVVHQTIQTVMQWMESRYPDVVITNHTMEFL
jgi:uncharacterized protein YlxP (DUF503 family)